MRSTIRLPDSIRLLSAYLRQAGYYATNNVKEDYNFASPKDAWDASSRKAHWKNRKDDQPFFAVFNYTGTHESRIWEEHHAAQAQKLTEEELHDPAKAPIPPFHPDTPATRRDWANYHDNISGLDKWVADHLKQLEEAGVADTTIVFFYSDHGAGMPLVKKWVWNDGLRVPLLVYFPQKYRHLASGPAVGVTDRLVSFVDFPPTVLSLAGVSIPDHMQGRPFLGTAEKPPRQYAFAIRDRMTEWFDVVRVVRDKRYQYHRNFMPHQPVRLTSYTLRLPTARLLVDFHEQGKLNAVQERYFQPKPTEELYDLEKDPHCVRNLAANPSHQDRLTQMRRELRQWQLRSRDLGLMSEYEMHRRAAGSTPYEMGRDTATWPLARVLPVAEMASRREPGNRARLVELLGDEEPIVRWWAALGLVMLGEGAAPTESALKLALEDASPLVRVAAAEALYGLGRVDAARPAMAEALRHATPFIRLRAMNVLASIGAAARPLIPDMQAAAMEDIHPAEYLNRMVKYLPERLSR